MILTVYEYEFLLANQRKEIQCLTACFHKQTKLLQSIKNTMLINNIYLFIFVVYLKFYRTYASENNIDEFLTATFATSSFYVTSSLYLLKKTSSLAPMFYYCN